LGVPPAEHQSPSGLRRRSLYVLIGTLGKSKKSSVFGTAAFWNKREGRPAVAAFSAERVDLGQHPPQEEFSGSLSIPAR
jgi:hypothetical protein